MLKTLKKRLKNQRGLTLVELLAVIVILGIISAIAVPSIGNIIEDSRNDATVQDAIQIINAAKIAHAANSNVSTWTDVDGLDDFLASAEDGTFTVTLASGTFSIDNHDVETIVADADNNGVTEAELKAALD